LTENLKVVEIHKSTHRTFESNYATLITVGIDFVSQCLKSFQSPKFFLFWKKYEEGIEVEKDLSQAMNYYKKAPDMNHLKAIFRYGVGLDDGYLGQPNKFEAMKYNKKSADLGYEDAQKLINIF
jgi:TPR repeat protein